MTNINQRLKTILKLHFDPENGARFWVEKAAQLGIDPEKDIQGIRDLSLFGPMDTNALAGRCMEDFVPRCFHTDKSLWIVGETGGTTGTPTPTVFLADEFHEAFVAPFVAAAAYRGFPKKLNWLWVGPGGPHIIGKAARACAAAMGSPDPFSVDFDPRWVKKFAAGSMGFERYLDHVIQQTLRVINTQHVGVLFTTPKVLMRLGPVMSEEHRHAIAGVHFGGMTLERDQFCQIAEFFPNAVFISGYGNSLFGMCPEFSGDPDLPMEYYPLGERLIFSVVPADDGLTAGEKLCRPLEPGATGQIVFSRLDKSLLIINQVERDQGTLLDPSPLIRDLGFTGCGIRNPGPLPLGGDNGHSAIGLY